MTQDNSTYGKAVVAASFLALFSLFGYRATFSILKIPMSASMDWTQAEVSLGYSFMMVLYALSSFGCGLILDKWGTKPVYIVGAVLGGAGFYLTSYSDSLIYYFFSFGVVAGIATGMLWVSSTVSIRQWFIGGSYAKMFGIAFAGGPVAQVVMSLFVRQILGDGTDPDAWRGAMRTLGIMIFLCMVVAAFLAKKRPEQCGMKPIGEAPGAAPTKEYMWKVKEAFGTYAVWAAIIVFLTSMLSEFLVWTQVVSYWTADLGLDLATATSLYVVIGIIGIFSMPIMGIVSDKVVKLSVSESQGRKRMLIIGPIVGAVACAILLMQTSESIFPGYLSCFIFAIYWAIVPGSVVGYVGSVYGRPTLGKIWGLCTLIVMGIGPFVGPLIGGYLKDVTGFYTYSIVFALVAFLVSSLFALTLPLKAVPAQQEAPAEEEQK